MQREIEHSWQELVNTLVRGGTLRTPRIIAAFQEILRSLFVPPEHARAAVTVDAPLSIGQGQTVSQPTTVATILELLQPQPGEKILDIGTGSGWQAALLAHIVGSTGNVFTIERIPELARRAAIPLKQFPNVTPLVGDATRGVPEHAPYDVIVSAASSPNVPSAWSEQLVPAGRLLHPIAGMGLRLLVKNVQGQLSQEDYPGFVFVPLISDNP